MTDKETSNLEKEKDQVTEKTQTKAKKSKTEKTESQADNNPLIKKFSVSVSKEDFSTAFDQMAEKYSSEIKLPGFRKGKTPVSVIKERYKDSLNDEVINKVIEKAVFQKIEQDKIQIVAPPGIEKINFKEGQDLKADVAVEVFPDVVLPDLEKLVVKVAKKRTRVRAI